MMLKLVRLLLQQLLVRRVQHLHQQDDIPEAWVSHRVTVAASLKLLVQKTTHGGQDRTPQNEGLRNIRHDEAQHLATLGGR